MSQDKDSLISGGKRKMKLKNMQHKVTHHLPSEDQCLASLQQTATLEEVHYHLCVFSAEHNVIEH